MRFHVALFAVASLVLAGCAAESGDPASENTDQATAPLTPEEWNAAATGERYSATVRPSSPEQQQQNESVVTHSGNLSPITASAHFQTVVSYGDHKP